MAALTPQTAVVTGLAPSFVAAGAGGDTFANPDGRTYLHVKNASGGAITVTITSTAAASAAAGTQLLNAGGSVPATTGERIFGPFSPAAFNDGNGNVAVTYSGVTSLTVAVVRVSL